MLKAPLILLDKSKDEISVCLGDKKHVVPSKASAALTISTLGQAASGTLSKPEGFGASLSVAGRIFTDI